MIVSSQFFNLFDYILMLGFYICSDLHNYIILYGGGSKKKNVSETSKNHTYREHIKRFFFQYKLDQLTSHLQKQIPHQKRGFGNSIYEVNLDTYM